jgi:hypothetical protein
MNPLFFYIMISMFMIIIIFLRSTSNACIYRLNSCLPKAGLIQKLKRVIFYSVSERRG